MKAQLEETPDVASKAEMLREALVAEDALRRGEDYLRLTIDTIPVLAWCTRPDGSRTSKLPVNSSERANT